MNIVVGNDIPLILSVGNSLGGISGLTVTVAIRRGTDYLDWDDVTFKPSDWATKERVMTEFDAGHYGLQLSSSSCGANAGDIYVCQYAVSGSVTAIASEAVTFVAPEIDYTSSLGGISSAISTVGSDVTDLTSDVAATTATVDDIFANTELERKHRDNQLWEAEGDPGTLILYDDDNSTPLRTWELADKDGNAVIGVSGWPARRSKAV